MMSVRQWRPFGHNFLGILRSHRSGRGNIPAKLIAAAAAAPSKGVIVLAMAASGADVAFHPYEIVQIT